MNQIPKTVAELGPGDSLGIGLAAMLCGSDKYYALDVVKFANAQRNIPVLEELIALFERREAIPDDTEFPGVHPKLDCYDFPHEILGENMLAASLHKQRLEKIAQALRMDSPDSRDPDIEISYFAPWYDPEIVAAESVDFAFSQAVMEHVEDLDLAYGALSRWLKPGAIMSHEIDFCSHSMTKNWNGHWILSDLSWKIIKGARTYLLNRQPHSHHLKLLEKYRFDLTLDICARMESQIPRDLVLARRNDFSGDDPEIKSAFVQSVKS